MKILRLDTIASQRPEYDPLDVIQEDFEREATIWNMARDFRILPLYGYAFIDDIPALISPYYSRGNAVEYLARDPDAERKGIVIFYNSSGSLPLLDTLQVARQEDRVVGFSLRCAAEFLLQSLTQPGDLYTGSKTSMVNSRPPGIRIVSGVGVSRHA